MEHWPAMSKWTDMEYLSEVAGDRTVPVEVGENYLKEGWGQQLMLVSDLLRLTLAQKVAFRSGVCSSVIASVPQHFQ